MTFVAEFTIPASELFFGAVLEDHADLTIEFENIVPTHRELLPFVFVWADGKFEAIEADIRRDSAVERLEEVDRIDGGRLYRIDWMDSKNGIGRAIRESEATLHEAVGTDDSWTFEIRFRSQERVETFQELVREYDIDLVLERLRTEFGATPTMEYDLTEKQYETLVTAFEAGFFENPKETSLEELGEELGVSDAAVTGRMQRGLGNLLSQTIVQQGDSH